MCLLYGLLFYFECPSYMCFQGKLPEGVSDRSSNMFCQFSTASLSRSSQVPMHGRPHVPPGLVRGGEGSNSMPQLRGNAPPPGPPRLLVQSVGSIY